MANDDRDVIRVPCTDREFYRGKILVVLLASLAITMMAISAINVALPSIESSLNASGSDIQWLLSGYALVFGVVLVAAGRMGDALGRSTLFVIGVALFTLASLGCGLSTDPQVLNLFRFVQGAGAGISSPQVNGIILQYFGGHKRARAFALFGLTVSVSVAVAPTLTGLLINWFGAGMGWRASFLWNVPIGLATVLLSSRWLPFGQERERRIARTAGATTRQNIDLDPIGGLILAAAVVAIMLPFMIKTPVSFVLLPIGIGLMAGWIAWEKWYKSRGREPMVDLNLFKYRSFTNGVLVSGTMFIGSTSIFAILALYVQNGLGAPAVIAGLLGLPNAIASAFASMWAGNHVFKRGRTIVYYSFWLFIAAILGCIVLAQFMGPGTANISYVWLSVPLMLGGAAVGAINSANQTLSQLDIPPTIGGTAGAVKQVAERIATAIGNAMTTAILFAFTSTSWRLGFTYSYAVIALIFVAAMWFAFRDLKMLRNPDDTVDDA